MVRRTGLVLVLLLGSLGASCRRKPVAAVLPDVTVGAFGNDAGVSIGAATASFGTQASLSIEYAAQSSRACLLGAHVRTTSLGETCQLTIGAFDFVGDAGASAASARIPLELVCGDANSHSQTTNWVKLTCDLTSQPPTVHVESGGSTLHVEESTHLALAPLPPIISPADRAVLERPVTFAKKSAALSEPMGALVVEKAKILQTHPTVGLWVTGRADELNSISANRDLSEKRSGAVMKILEGWIRDEKRLNRFSLGDIEKRGAGVFFEVKLPE